MQNAKQALVLIDIQNDYFEGGRFPLYQPEQTLDRMLQLVEQARQREIPVILVQHIAANSPAAFFEAGSVGADLHARLLAALPQAPVVIKQQADSFYQTELEATLAALGIEELLLAGMMTHNCVTHTAISPAAAKYRVKVVADCSATVSDMLHKIALNALSVRVELLNAAELF